MPLGNTAENPAVASVDSLVKLRYGSRELTGFPKVQARQMLAGGHRSRFRGRGMDFEEVRIYQPGDDVRTIDWRVTARTESPHTKVFREERERPILVVTDLRGPMFFGSARLKSVVASEVSAALAWAGLNANDRIGAMLFGQADQADVKSRRSYHAALKFIHLLQEYSARLLELQEDRYSLSGMLEESRRFVLPGTTIFLVSDFNDLDDNCERHLFELARHGNLNFCQIYDPLEAALPPPALYAVTDGVRRTILDAKDNRIRENFEEQFRLRGYKLRRLSEKLSAGLLQFSTAENVMAVLARAYGRRRRK